MAVRRISTVSPSTVRRQIINIRTESQSDTSTIEALTVEAFREAPHSSHTEHFIVDALRKANKLSVSLVAEIEEGIVGHVAVS
ncbi:Acetyltransferase, GNAT family, partial [hydrothermal vent metagenome]